MTRIVLPAIAVCLALYPATSLRRIVAPHMVPVAPGTRVDLVSSQFAFYERVAFCVLAVFVWIFIVRNLYTAYVTRRALMEEVAALPRIPPPDASASAKGDKQH